MPKELLDLQEADSAGTEDNVKSHLPRPPPSSTPLMPCLVRSTPWKGQAAFVLTAEQTLVSVASSESGKWQRPRANHWLWFISS